MNAAGFPMGAWAAAPCIHVAFRVPDEETQLALREEVAALGYSVTPVLDRNYFRSIYFASLAVCSSRSPLSPRFRGRRGPRTPRRRPQAAALARGPAATGSKRSSHRCASR